MAKRPQIANWYLGNIVLLQVLTDWDTTVGY